jgi:polyphenol oxidase
MFPVHQQPGFNNPPFRHGWTACDGPDFKGSPQTSAHAQLVDLFSHAVDLQTAAWATQVHGGDVIKVEGGGWSGQADGLWTDQPGLGVIGRSADCPIILIGGPKSFPGDDNQSHAWGFAHASWRSTLAGITSTLVQCLVTAGVQPSSMQAVICPSAGPCCYEVKNDVVEAAMKTHPDICRGWFMKRKDKIFLDLWLANQDIMIGEGLSAGQILTTEMCTICNSGFHSYRRDGDAAGRFAAIIGCI